MGICITDGADGRTLLVLTCDGDHGLFGSRGCRVLSQSFSHPDGYVGQYNDAMKAGWKDCFRDGRRVFLGPCCSGKRHDE
jgi:hypothetical protein